LSSPCHLPSKARRDPIQSKPVGNVESPSRSPPTPPDIARPVHPEILLSTDEEIASFGIGVHRWRSFPCWSDEPIRSSNFIILTARLSKPTQMQVGPSRGALTLERSTHAAVHSKDSDARLPRQHRHRLVHLPSCDRAAGRRRELLAARLGDRVPRVAAGRAVLLSPQVSAQRHRRVRLLRAFLRSACLGCLGGLRDRERRAGIRDDARATLPNPAAVRHGGRSEEGLPDRMCADHRAGLLPRRRLGERC